ncbi:enoyl-CoA hydratase-related protein [Streptomyces sp. NPDC047130]|uniref:enoyl-CoA hydratase-related protein n=1 Tax=Streptomyces sp. NPDC047130 TaxID=3155261 RepID=UPI0033DD185A
MTGRTSVTRAVEPPLGIVRLTDTRGGNRIDDPLWRTFDTALRSVVSEPEVRVVLVEGLPGMFCSGLAPEPLRDARHRVPGGLGQFAEVLVRCPLPVVVAAQGHALGGGLLFALGADAVVLSRTSSYAANFMSLGFTPCMGATYLLPHVLGAALGQEMLFTGRPYRGAELAVRGAGVDVTSAPQVPAQARRTALRIARAPRRSLELLKGRFAQERLAGLARAMEAEVAAHDETRATALSSSRGRDAEAVPR